MCPHDESAVLLACPAQVGHGLCYNNLWSQLSPEAAEERVTDTTGALLCGCCIMVQFPHLFLRDGGGEKLHVIPLVEK